LISDNFASLDDLDPVTLEEHELQELVAITSEEISLPVYSTAKPSKGKLSKAHSLGAGRSQLATADLLPNIDEERQLV
jgi:hypothetical protein